jgi:hypothetical protein
MESWGGAEMVAEVRMSSTADEEELCMSVVSTDIVAATSRRSQRRRKCQRKGQRGAGAKRLGFGNWGRRHRVARRCRLAALTAYTSALPEIE